MGRYDALQPPSPTEWLGLDEGERLDLVLRSHRRAGEEAPDARLHATVHVVVENQIAMGDPPEVSGTVTRLMDEGLDRHDAIHAVGSVLAGRIFSALKDGGERRQLDRDYLSELTRLSAKEWRQAR